MYKGLKKLLYRFSCKCICCVESSCNPDNANNDNNDNNDDDDNDNTIQRTNV